MVFAFPWVGHAAGAAGPSLRGTHTRRRARSRPVLQHHPTDTPWDSESETAALLSHAGPAHGSTQAGELRVAWYSLFRGSDMLLVPLALLSVEHTRVGVPGLAPCCNTIRPRLRGTPRVRLRLHSLMRAPHMAAHKLASSRLHGIRFSVLVSLVQGMRDENRQQKHQQG